jgi:homoserine O-acetyltransferase
MEKGEYTAQPKVGLSIGQLMFMVSSPLQWQKSAPTREAEEMLDKLVERYLSMLMI